MLSIQLLKNVPEAPPLILNISLNISERKNVEKKLSQVNLELEELATTDQFTGLNNRRNFDELFESELQRAKKNICYFALIMFDIDYF